MAKKQLNGDIPLELAKRISEETNNAFNDGSLFEDVTPTTRDLIKFWFCEPYIETRDINFHEGQRQSILNTIYLHEVLKVENVLDIYNRVAEDLLPFVNMVDLKKEKYSYPKYAIKMATGTGKTWVMHALMIWQLLNAKHEEQYSSRYTKNFLIVAPGIIVYDRLLDAFKGKIKEGTQERDERKNDYYSNEDLFLPPAYKEEIISFIQNNTVTKDEIGKKITGEGLIAITNWHLFMSRDETTDNEELETDELYNGSSLIKDLLPARPSLSAGNSLEQLDRQYLRGNELDYLAELPNLMVINDEAHHIHENKVNGEIEEVEWQEGLNFIARNKLDKFMQVDFSATPYDTVGSGRNTTKRYFPYIITDFDLKTAILKGLVKTILIDKRQEITNLENLDFKAIREGKKVISLSDGQILMLRAGLEKIKKLEEDFVKLDQTKHPKMLVMCEDTSVTEPVERFLIEEGLNEQDVLRVDSNRQGEIGEKEWKVLKEKLFNVDKYSSPKVIVSVLMLREGFDVNNICVIVPLRASNAPILLEQTIGRGLRQMWRGKDYEEHKRENRINVFNKKISPNSYIDMLSIVEHPAFMNFYDDLLNEGLAGIEESEQPINNPIGDIIKVELKEDYKDYDLYWPIVIKDVEEDIKPIEIDINNLNIFDAFTLEQLQKAIITQGEVFISKEITVGTQFGKYEVNANLFNAQTYNEYLQKILKTITNRIDKNGRSSREFPMLQINEVEIVGLIDKYIRRRLFDREFNPFESNNWKILLVQNGVVTQHIIKEMGKAIFKMQNNIEVSDAIIEKRFFSEVNALRIRENFSLDVSKTIFDKLGYPSNRGNLEKSFIEFLDLDADVESFIKINETQHRFSSIFYIRQDGLLSNYSPDFLVKTKDKYYVIETKGEDKKNDSNVKQKQLATIEWCKKINSLNPEFRDNREWEYILLAENDFYTWKNNSASLIDICKYAKVVETAIQGTLF
jgi:type III restriction enzyme